MFCIVTQVKSILSFLSYHIVMGKLIDCFSLEISTRLHDTGIFLPEVVGSRMAACPRMSTMIRLGGICRIVTIEHSEILLLGL